MRVRIAPRSPAGPCVTPVAEGDGQWRITLGPDAEAAGALAGARLAGERHGTLDLRGLPPDRAVAFITGTCLRAWSYDRLRSKKPDRLRRLDILTDDPAPLRRAWHDAKPVLAGVTLARNLVSEPSNTLTPSGFVHRLKPLAKAGVTIEVLKPRALRHAGLGGLLAVGGGSAHKPRLVVLRWPGVTDADPVVFVGKGITFDTGGLCIKPAAGMEVMGTDMARASIAPAPAAAVLALAENAVGASSYRPSDILRMGDGTTVEVVDSDAEGRLVLADALAWAVRHLRPAAIVDLATLTGSIIVALGCVMAGLFDNDPAFAAHVAAAGEAVGDAVWRMPIGAGHREDLRSDIADVRQCLPGPRQPDACHAAAFLHRFVGDVPWAHLDIAGLETRPEATDRHAAGASGFGVRLLDRLVTQRFEDPHR